MAEHQTAYHRTQRTHHYHDIEHEPNNIDRILQLASYYYCSFTYGEYSNSFGMIGRFELILG